LYVPYRILRVIVKASTDAPAEYRQTANHPSPQASREAVDESVKLEEVNPGGAPMRGADVHRAAFHGTGAPWRRRGHTGWRQAAHAELLARPVRDRASSLIGSMLAAGVVAPVASLLACMVFAPDLPVELVLWTGTVATLASWALMVPGQLAEARMEDHAPLRFMQLLLGAVVGLAAWAVAQSLYLDIPASHDFSPGPGDSLSAQLFSQRYDSLQQAYRAGSVQMPPAMYAAYFAFFFLVLRWWRLSESTRSTRVSLWLTAWTAFIGWAMTFFWWFPQPIGLMLAAVIAFTVQLSSPWLSPSRRRELAQRAA
ncbi:MAG: hypothetical protein H0T51_23750, partial [Pirellulales bacterium]|nr:hypothetical protein [Pirellulales bacterium]